MYNLRILHYAFSPPSLCAVIVLHFTSTCVISPAICCYIFALNNRFFLKILNINNPLFYCILSKKKSIFILSLVPLYVMCLPFF